MAGEMEEELASKRAKGALFAVLPKGIISV